MDFSESCSHRKGGADGKTTSLHLIALIHLWRIRRPQSLGGGHLRRLRSTLFVFGSLRCMFFQPLCHHVTLNVPCGNSLEGAGRVGHGSDSLLFRLREGKCANFFSLSLCHFITSGSTKGNSEVFISQTAMLVGHSAEQKSNLSGFFVVVFLGCLFEINISLRRSSNSMCPPCVFFFCSPSFFLLHLQCPFIDEYILALHNKIRTRPVEFPET